MSNPIGQLQEICQKAHKTLPAYSEKWIGDNLFECMVTFELLDGNYTSTIGTGPSKAVAKKNACAAALTIILGGDGNELVNYKSMLQELFQKDHLELPKYTTNHIGLYPPKFQSFVTVTESDGKPSVYTGEVESSKKMAEQSAAKSYFNP